MKKSILHTLAAYIIYRVSFDFSLFAYSVDLPGSLQRLLAVSLAIACILGLIYLYTKYLMNSSVQEINLGKPLPDPKWCMIGIILPCTISLFYILFIPGKFRWENLPLQTMFEYALVFENTGETIMQTWNPSMFAEMVKEMAEELSVQGIPVSFSQGELPEAIWKANPFLIRRLIWNLGSNIERYGDRTRTTDI